MALLDSARGYVAQNIKPGFHDKRLTSLEGLRLTQVLKRKNPYLFRAKAITNAPDLVRQIVDAHLSSNEETLFGEFLEDLAVFVCNSAYQGQKSTSEGIDLEFNRDGVRYAVSIKSGPNWGNARQIKKLRDDFDRIRRVAGHRVKVVCVNGCCYGQDGRPNKEAGNYLKLCGQDFWFLISGEPQMYVTLIQPLGFEARKRCDDFQIAYDRALTRFTRDFIDRFCAADGSVNWPELLEFNSGSKSNWQP